VIIFSYTFFFKGYTGLAITVASIVTLAILMHATAKVDWETRFATPEQAPQPPGSSPPTPTPQPKPTLPDKPTSASG